MVSLPCTVYGSPKPRIVWTKGNEQLTGGNFKVLPSGALQITVRPARGQCGSVVQPDAGGFPCGREVLVESKQRPVLDLDEARHWVV